MTASERREKILSLVNQTEGIKSSELAERLSVTTETIRKDLIYLDKKKLLHKFHGYVKPATEASEHAFEFRIGEEQSSKYAIAQAAFQQLTNCTVIFIDAGSTTYEFAKYLKMHIEDTPALSSLTIITNSFSVVQALNGIKNAIYFIGGEINMTTQSTNGFWASNELRSLHIDVAFLGSSGFSSHHGPCTRIGSDTLVKNEVIHATSKTIVLADHTKFSSNAILQYAPWSAIDLLITDGAVSKDELKLVQNLVEVLTAQ